MRIEAYRLKRFVKKASLGGTITSINIDFQENGIHSRMIDAGKIAMTQTFLSRDLFEDYEAIGEIFIKDTSALMNYLNTFGSYVDLSIKDDFVLRLSDDTRVGDVMLGAEVVCDGVYRENLPNLELEDSATISKQDLDRTVKDMSLLKISNVKITREKTGVVFEVGDEGKSDYFKNMILATDGKGTESVVIGDTFLRLYDSLDKDFCIELKNNLPIRVTEECDGLEFTCIVAPVILDD